MKSVTRLSATILIGAFVGCAAQGNQTGNSPFQQLGLQALGSSILGSTGLVSSSQAGAIFKAGSHLAKAASPLSEEQEYYLGRSVAATILARYKPLNNSELNRYLTTVANTVALHSDRPETFGGYHVMALDSNEVNALSAPGGFIFVTKGFLKLVPDEDALAALFAHEVAHIVKAHGVNAVSSGNLSKAVSVIGKEAVDSQLSGVPSALYNAFDESVEEVVDSVLVSGYSRRQEYSADEYAVKILKRAGYNPYALKSMLDVLNNKTATEASGGWFSTHPSAEDRIEEIVDDGLLKGTSPTVPSQKVRSARFRSAIRALS